MPTITAYIIAYNEAEKIDAAVSSVLWADEIVVADSGSTDGTAERATALGARVVQIPFQGFGNHDRSPIHRQDAEHAMDRKRTKPAVTRQRLVHQEAGEKEKQDDAAIAQRQRYCRGMRNRRGIEMRGDHHADGEAPDDVQVGNLAVAAAAEQNASFMPQIKQRRF